MNDAIAPTSSPNSGCHLFRWNTDASIAYHEPPDTEPYELRGFGVQVERTSTKTYFVRYRPKGLGRSGPRRFLKLGRHGDLTTEEARDLAKAVLGQVAQGLDPAATRDEARRRAQVKQLSFQEVGDLFLREHVDAKRKAMTKATYETLLRRYAYPTIGRKSAAHVTNADLAKLDLAMRQNPASGNRTITVISSMYSFAAKRGLVPEGFNPARGIEKFREEGRERYLTTVELQQLGSALIEAESVGVPWVIDEANPKSKHTPKIWKQQRQVADPGAVAAIRLLLFTGPRLREILHLEWTQFSVSVGSGLRLRFRFPLDGDRIRRRRSASPVAASSRAAAR